ncbi:MAG: hypothetical protein AAB702_02625 [Patescibacteria group bacterium]
MLSSEFSPIEDPGSEIFFQLPGFEKQEAERIGEFFNLKLIKGFYRVSFDKKDRDILTILPSLDITRDIGLIDGPSDSIIVALSRLKGIEDIIDLVSCRYIDKERLDYGQRTIPPEYIIRGQEKSLSCTKTILPLIQSGERFELTKGVYTLHRHSSTVYPQREIMLGYSLSWSSVTSLPGNS